jgi:hypothetical protein
MFIGARGRRGRKARAEQHRALPGVKMPAPNAWQQGVEMPRQVEAERTAVPSAGCSGV